MQAKFRGYFVPPRPEKNAVEGQRMSDAFVEERRASLQKYLQKLAAHPVIGPSEVGWGLPSVISNQAAGVCEAADSHAPLLFMVPAPPTKRAVRMGC